MNRIDRPDDGWLATAVFWGLMAAVFWAPLPFASNRPWAWLALSVAILVIFGLWGMAALRRPYLVRVGPARHAPATLLFMLAILWFLLQTTSWLPQPDPALWRQTAQTLGVGVADTASLDPRATLQGITRFLGYGAVFWLAMQYGHDPHRAEHLLWVIAAAGTAYAVYGLAVYLGGNETILGYPRWAYGGDLTSTFVNRNAYGAYAGLGLLAALGLIVRLTAGGASLGLGNRAGLAHFIDSLEPKFFLLVMASLTMATALLLSHSRGALAATVLGVSALFAGLAARPGDGRRNLWIGVVGIVVVGAGIIELSGRETLGRYLSLADQGTGRQEIHDLARRAISDAPVAGFGLDTFPQVFHLYRDASFDWRSPRFDKAHNAYLELAVEAGIVGFAAIAGALCWIVGSVTAGLFRRRRNRTYPAVALGATVLVGSHAVYDFSVQIPAVAVTWLALLGMGFAQAWPTRNGDTAGHRGGPQY